MSYDNGYSLADIAAATGRNGDGFGEGYGSWWIILFIIVLFGGWGNRGFGGFGGNSGGGTSVYEGYVLNNDFSQIERKLDGIANGICDSTFALNNTVVNGNAAIQQTLTQGFSGLNTGMIQQGYETRIGINGVNTQLAQCCCDLKGLVAENKYENAQNVNALNNNINAGFVGLQNSMCINTRDIIDNQNANYRALHDEIVANRIEDKNAQIQAQQAKISALELAASQAAQNNYLVDKLGYHMPVAAYQVPNPYCNCNCNNNCCC